MSDPAMTIYDRYRSLAGYPKIFRWPSQCQVVLEQIVGSYTQSFDLNRLALACRIGPRQYQIPPFLSPEEFGAWLNSSGPNT